MADEAIPSQWLPVLERRFEPGTSIRKMSEQMGMYHTTLIRVFKGKTSHKAIEHVAAALRISTDDVYELRGEVPTTPYKPPEQSRHLSTTQRAALDAVINAMLENVADQVNGDATVHEIGETSADDAETPATLGDFGRRGRAATTRTSEDAQEDR